MIERKIKIYLVLVIFISILVIFVQPSLLGQNNLNSLQEQLGQIQHDIEGGNLTRAQRELSKLTPQTRQLAHVRAIAANLALRQGDYHNAIATYQKLESEPFGTGANRLPLLNNYIRALQGRAKIYQTLADDDYQERNSLKERAQENRKQVLELAREAIALKTNELAQIHAELNLAQLISGEVDLVKLTQEIDTLTDSPTKVELWVALSQLIAEPLPYLERAVALAQQLKDFKGLASAWGMIGKYYEERGDYLHSLDASYRATWATQQTLNTNDRIQWQWLSAKSLKALKREEEALSAFRNAIASIEQLRQELAGSRVGQAFYFDTIDPLLQDFLSFLLEPEEVSQETLSEAITLLSLRQLSELDTYFGDICEASVNSTATDTPDRAIIYTLLLPQKAYEILKVNGNYSLHPLKVSSLALKQQVSRWRIDLQESSFYKNWLIGSRNLYQILITPIKSKLLGVEQLTFVQDNILRNVPMAALYDEGREQFLIEKLAIDYSLGLEEASLDIRPRSPLLVGSTQASRIFPNPLPLVREETETLQALLGGTRLLDREFTPQNLADKLQTQNYNLLHLASHGQFSGLIEESFIQTGTKTLTLKEFQAILGLYPSSLKHLTFSACETATGSRYAVLGLAGIAIRSAEIKSVLGSLWMVQDYQTSEFVKEFYQNWHNGDSLIQAQKKAQIHQIEAKTHPASWAAFILLKS